MGTVSPGSDYIVNLPTLLSGSILSQFSEQTITPTTLSCISYIGLSPKGELFCLQLFSVFQPQALSSCQSQSRTYLSENPRTEPNRSFLELFREKHNWKMRGFQYQGIAMYA